MFETNSFSGHSYVTSGSVKTREDGITFVKSGDSWIGNRGQIIKQDGSSIKNLTTGIQNNFGDPFGDDDDEL